MGPQDDDPISRLDHEAILAEADALGEELPSAEDGSPVNLGADVEFLAAFEVSRSWDIWLADMLRMRRRFLDTVILTFEPRAATLALLAHRPAGWSGDYRGAVARDVERATDGVSSTLEFANFALDVAMREGRLALTVFSTAFDVGGVSFSVRAADGRAVSRGETDMLGRLELVVPVDLAFDLVLEPPSQAPA